MWLVRNLLRGILVFPGLDDGKDLEIPPKAEFDLDRIGRERAEASNQLLVAFEEGYLQNVYKEPLHEGEAAELPLGERLEQFKRSIVEEVRALLASAAGAPPAPIPEATSLTEALADLREQITADVEQVREALGSARRVLETERRKVIHDTSLSDAEVRARLAFLEDQERQLERNFDAIGRRESGSDDDLLGKADLLSRM